MRVSVLFFRQFAALIRISRPTYARPQTAYGEEQEACPHPQESLTSIRNVSPEQKRVPFSRGFCLYLSPMIIVRPSIPLSEIDRAAGKALHGGSRGIFKHGTPPLRSGKNRVEISFVISILTGRSLDYSNAGNWFPLYLLPPAYKGISTNAISAFSGTAGTATFFISP